MAIKFLTGINSNGAIDASGGITGLDLSNGISGSNFNITGVNEIRINDPGEGIVWTSGSSGNMSLAIKDDSLDNILNLSGTGAQLAVNNAIVATQAWVGSQGYLTSITDHNHDTLYDSLGSAAAVGQQLNERIDTEVFDAIATVDGNIPTNNNQLTNGAGYVTGVNWSSVGAGTRTNYDLKLQPPSSGYAGFQFLNSAGDNAGYFLVRGTSNNGVYTANGITLVADTGWLTIAQRTSTSAGVRIMTGTTSKERIIVKNDGKIAMNPTDSGNFDAVLTIGSGGDGRIQTRHIWGKRSYDDNPDNLYINYQNTGKHVQIGDNNGGNNLYVSGNIYANGFLAGNKVATESYVNIAVANVIDSAPGALNTLNELAAALGDDANFSTTVTNELGKKLSVSGGTISRDGMLDVIPSSYSYANGSHLELYTNDNHVPAIGFHRGGVSATTLYEEQGELFITKWDGSASGAKLWHSGDFDPGSFLSTTGKAADSNLLDGINSTSFLRSDQNDTMSGALTITNAATGLLVDSAGHASVRLDRGSTSHDANLLFYTAGVLNWRMWMDGDDDYLYIRDEVSARNMLTFRRGAGIQAGNAFWANVNSDSVFNNYNENLRLPPAGNDVSVIAFRASGEGGVPSSSILGYSDRHETRIGGTWRQRIYSSSVQYNAQVIVTGDITTSAELNLPNSHSGSKIQLHGGEGDAHCIGTSTYNNTYGPVNWTSGTLGHVFYGATNSPIAVLGNGGATAGAHTSTFFGDVIPSEDRIWNLGGEVNRWRIVFCEILDSAGQHEKNLQNPEGEKSVGAYQTGTVLVWKGGKNIPCTEYADHMRMGIAVEGIDSPLIQGAEPVLVTGPVNEGDYLVTSLKEGHAEAMSPEVMRQQNLFDCVIGKALESGDGESYLIKTWINI